MAEDYFPDIPIPPPKNRGYLQPFILPPRRQHTHTVILLHGRGGNGRDFGVELITTKLLSCDTLPQRFPSTKFIFPTAKLRRSTQFKRIPIAQWFDLTNLGTENERRDIQHEGLRESAQFVHRIIEEEAALVGIGNVVVGGLSQGAAQALHILMSYDDGGKGGLGGYVGMSGWLPFQKEMAELVNEYSRDANGDRLDDPFERNGEDGPAHLLNLSGDSRSDLGARAVNFSRECVLDIDPLPPRDTAPGCLSTPIWLAHGALDEKVRPRLGELAAQTMEKLGWDVTWMLYDDLEHWFAPYELDDMAIFLSARVGIPEVD
ncbi:Phospholipase/Carboxylesterase family protein [Coccidioides posadasii C735 delta SOWgp]|uniref:Phospholipase/carboxylesterase/thioesterase domain-containing protein n=3 Tax=Coccidioides posadasii TaxID=199306 RepID=E9D202_COCPS|nr:Phospholipase/Carboxylesterase family protein [Coccidioides posadasii C735 delta SOWgp]EER24902.1 Phospholipase/Carboxylesterase family protein [Coccidioides posadasii C735 delta SOWgp]EFW19216.1 conserved hypothetical protein [Coccidioides posadasii str. Silveira]KMM71681.1 hypothetical protein CPAG_07984 [Coccidioides posadasii RMSCC 3488]|eukprot:XP_003067047.1 Phospholipase/Carboxylesterase family protein [Coccidioides posadasii C735 delta SOWgp]